MHLCLNPDWKSVDFMSHSKKVVASILGLTSFCLNLCGFSTFCSLVRRCECLCECVTNCRLLQGRRLTWPTESWVPSDPRDPELRNKHIWKLDGWMNGLRLSMKIRGKKVRQISSFLLKHTVEVMWKDSFAFNAKCHSERKKINDQHSVQSDVNLMWSPEQNNGSPLPRGWQAARSRTGVSGAAFKPLNLQQSPDFTPLLILVRRRRIRRSSSAHPSTRAVTGSSSAPGWVPPPPRGCSRLRLIPVWTPLTIQWSRCVLYTGPRPCCHPRDCVCLGVCGGAEGSEKRGLGTTVTFVLPTYFFSKCTPSFYYQFKIPAQSPSAGVKWHGGLL